MSVGLGTFKVRGRINLAWLPGWELFWDLTVRKSELTQVQMRGPDNDVVSVWLEAVGDGGRRAWRPCGLGYELSSAEKRTHHTWEHSKSRALSDRSKGVTVWNLEHENDSCRWSSGLWVRKLKPWLKVCSEWRELTERSEATKAAGRWSPSDFPQGSCSEPVSAPLMTLPCISLCPDSSLLKTATLTVMDMPLGMYYILQPTRLLATREPLGRLRTSDNFFFKIKHTAQIVRVNLFQDAK